MDISSLPPELAESISTRVAESTFVIVNKEKASVLFDPGTRLPYHTRNRKAAEFICKSAPKGSFVCTLADALKHHIKLLKN